MQTEPNRWTQPVSLLSLRVAAAECRRLVKGGCTASCSVLGATVFFHGPHPTTNIAELPTVSASPVSIICESDHGVWFGSQLEWQ